MNLSVFLMVMAALLLSGCDDGTPPRSGDAVPDRVSYTVATVAGTDADLGDGGPATDALLTFPYGVAADDAGNVYIADTENHRVRKVDIDGAITTIAGTGEEGFSGDGGAAVDAELDWPTGVAVDPGGAVYIADRGNERVRRVDVGGIIMTLAGNGEWGYDEEADGGPAAEARLNWPTGVALDDLGNVYIADQYNHRIRKVDAEGVITTVAGMGRQREAGEEDVGEEEEIGDGGPAVEARLNWPTGVDVDADGNLYIADRNNERVRKVDPAGVITTIAGIAAQGFAGDGGPAVDAELDHPESVAVDEHGHVYIADRGNNRVRRIESDGTIITVIGAEGSGAGGGLVTQLAAPRGIAIARGHDLYIADTGNHRILNAGDDGGIAALAGGAGLGDGGAAVDARLLSPRGLALADDGAMYIADSGNNRVRRVDAGGVITTFAGTSEQGEAGDGGMATSAQLDGPVSIEIGPQGDVYISDTSNNRIRRVDSEGTITTFAGTGEPWPWENPDSIGDGGPATSARLRGPVGLAFDAAGNLYIADSGHHRIRKVDTRGMISTIAGTGNRSFSGDDGPAADAQLGTPSGLAIDGEGNIYFTDAYGIGRIRKIDTQGVITTVAEVLSPGDVAVGKDGSLYVTEFYVGRILRLDPSGVFSIIAGSAQSGDEGEDGESAVLAEFDQPNGIEVDARGNVYVAETENNRVRRMTPGR